MTSAAHPNSIDTAAAPTVPDACAACGSTTWIASLVVGGVRTCATCATGLTALRASGAAVAKFGRILPATEGSR